MAEPVDPGIRGIRTAILTRRSELGKAAAGTARPGCTGNARAEPVCGYDSRQAPHTRAGNKRGPGDRIVKESPVKTRFARRSLVLGCVLAVAIATIIVLPAVSADDGAEVTLTGQVVCTACWGEQEDRVAHPYGSDADLKCAAKCSKRNITQSIAVWNDGKAELVVMEKGAFETKEKDFLSFVAKKVEVRGVVRTEGGKRIVRVNDLKVVDDK